MDALTANPPAGLAGASLSNVTFQNVNDEKELGEIHDHLFQRHALLDRVIRARKLHHSRFYALELDYGHQHYLDQLASQKHIVAQALERLERRTAEYLFEREQWFKWVRKLEEDGEKAREAEKKKVKLEAALFKRHFKEAQARVQELRRREDERRQAEILEKAWVERQQTDDEHEWETDVEEWDPIEDVVENERGNYIDLIRRFLWKSPSSTEPATIENGQKVDDQAPDREPLALVESNTAPASAKRQEDAPKSKSAKKRAKQKAKSTGTETIEQPNPGEFHIETAEEMRKRLTEGTKFTWGYVGTRNEDPSNPIKLHDRSFALPASEIDTLLEQVSEIKHLLLCRLVLRHATLLPIALRASSVDDFLADPEVSNTDLRDLCLKMEQPDRQDLRDACADLGRGEEADDDEGEPNGRPVVRCNRTRFLQRPTFAPRQYRTKREKKIKERRERTLFDEQGNPDAATFVDFGNIDDQQQYRVKKIRVKVCGRYIWNYPSEMVGKSLTIQMIFVKFTARLCLVEVGFSFPSLQKNAIYTTPCLYVAPGMKRTSSVSFLCITTSPLQIG